MSRICSVCTHHKKKEIEESLILGVSYRDIAGHYLLSKTALHRHKSEHLGATLMRAKNTEEVANADSLLKQVEALRVRALNILNKAEENHELKTALVAIREIRGCIELLGKLVGELNDNPQINIIISPQWVALRTVILEALDPYPDAKMSVSKALESLPNGNST